jgi:hypothetical protein
MGLLDRFIKQEVQGMSPEQVAMDEQQQYNQAMVAQGGGGYPGGRPVSPVAMAPMPPTLEKEVMEYYLKVKTPEKPEELRGQKRFWVFMDNDAASEVPTANMNAARQEKILTELTTAIDFDGCDNVDGLIQDNMLKIHAEVMTDKARSDFGDGLRERVIPSVGIGMAGQWNGNDGRGERPRESKALFGLGGGKGRM